MLRNVLVCQYFSHIAEALEWANSLIGGVSPCDFKGAIRKIVQFQVVVNPPEVIYPIAIILLVQVLE